ncbi:mis18-binding protein 1 isoform X2 [Sceloporus undulatus]|uniref:mis18-binding protein 1 isoform X2 n=1 Tax=Sceloporus undulatus TaxID=8520 RepID=UPI001C4C9E58|nr:mis18-binding protein 1 isoform X2 [Sceloporus undulatus]
MSWKAIPLSLIPGGTPLKDLVKYQVDGTCGSSAKQTIFPAVVLDHKNVCLEKEIKKGNIFQSTLIAGGSCDKEFIDLSEIKPVAEGSAPPLSCVNQEAVPLRQNSFLKRKAGEQMPFESPAKIFLRMKARTALKAQERKLLDTNSTADYILTPERCSDRLGRQGKIPKAEDDKPKEDLAEKPLGEPQVGKVSSIGVNRNTCGPVAGSQAFKSPHRFFSRVKQKLRQKLVQRVDAPVCQTKQNDPPSAALKPPSVTSNLAPQLNDLNGECINAPVSQDDTFIVEPVDPGCETFNLTVDVMDMSCGPIKPAQPLEEVAPRRLSQERRAAHLSSEKFGPGGQPVLGLGSQMPSQHLCDIIFGTPKVHIPRKQKTGGTACKPPMATPYADKASDGNKVEQQRIHISEWRIKVINNNTAVCLEGKRRDMNDIYWHSNAIVERIAHKQVKTLSGNIYVLEGRVDASIMKKEGMPSTFIKRFDSGIPRNWKMLVDDLLRSLRRKDRRSEDDSEGEDPVEMERLEELGVLPKDVKKKAKAKDVTYDVIDLQSNKKLGAQQKLSCFQNDPNVSFTRSGRCVKPPMQYWCGERILVDQEFNVTVTKGGTNYLAPVRFIFPSFCLFSIVLEWVELAEVFNKFLEALLSVSSARPQAKNRFRSPKENGVGNLEANKEVPPSQAKERTVRRAERVTREPENGYQQNLQQFVSDSEESDPELVINEICKRQAIVTLTPLNHKHLHEKNFKCSNQPGQKQNLPQQDRETNGCRTSYMEGKAAASKDPKQVRPQQPTEVSIPGTSDDDDDDDILCIKRKIQPPFRRGALRREQRDARKKPLQVVKATVNSETPSSQSKTMVVAHLGQDGRSETLPGENSSPDLAGGPAGHQERNRQGSHKGIAQATAGVLETESESEANIGERLPKKGRKEVAAAKANGQAASRTESASGAGRAPGKRQWWAIGDSLTDVNEDWSDKEVEKLHRAMASFPKHKNGFWLDVAMRVGSRTTEECQQRGGGQAACDRCCQGGDAETEAADAEFSRADAQGQPRRHLHRNSLSE